MSLLQNITVLLYVEYDIYIPDITADIMQTLYEEHDTNVLTHSPPTPNKTIRHRKSQFESCQSKS